MTRMSLCNRFAVAATAAVTGVIVVSLQCASAAWADGPPAPPAAKAESLGERDTWRLSGVVVDEQGKPVAGAVVRGAEGPGLSWIPRPEARTAGDGTFHLDLPRMIIRGIMAQREGDERIGLARFERSLSGSREGLRIVVKSPRVVTVRVKDAAGAPVAGAVVDAAELCYRSEPARTGPDGAAVLRVAADAQVEWVVGHKDKVGLDYFENYKSRIGEVRPSLPSEVGLTLDGAVTVRVKVVDSAGRLLPGIRVNTGSLRKPGKIDSTRSGLFESLSQTTDAQGLAVFAWVPASAFAVDFAPRSESYITTNAVQYGKDGPTELTAHMLRKTRLSGRVRLPDGQPAPGVVVLASGRGKGFGSEFTRTGADGLYAMEVNPEGIYMIGVSDKNWTAPSHKSILVREGQAQTGLDFTLVRGTLVRGRVTQGPGREAVKKGPVAFVEQGPLLPGAVRTPYDNEELLRRTETDEQGRYQIRVGQGLYKVYPGGRTEPELLQVSSEAEIVRDLSAVAWPAQRVLTGVVVVKTPQGERPVPRATVYPLSTGQYGSAPSPADEQGRFRVRHWPRSVIYAKGEQGALAGLLTVPEQVDDVKLILAPAVKVSGRVVDTSGRPWANRWVEVKQDFGSDPAESAHWRFRTRTDEQGRFSLAGVPVGTGGEFSAYHEKDGRPTPVHTTVPFRAPTLEPVEVPDLVIPAPEPAKPAGQRP